MPLMPASDLRPLDPLPESLSSGRTPCCCTQEWDGPMQFEDPSGKLMMLPSDIALIQDKKWRPIVKEYAADQALFFKEFTAAYTKLTELGTKNLKPVDV